MLFFSFFKESEENDNPRFPPSDSEVSIAQLLRPGKVEIHSLHRAQTHRFPHCSHSNRPGSPASQWIGFDRGSDGSVRFVCVGRPWRFTHTHTQGHFSVHTQRLRYSALHQTLNFSEGTQITSEDRVSSPCSFVCLPLLSLVFCFLFLSHLTDSCLTFGLFILRPDKGCEID